MEVLSIILFVVFMFVVLWLGVAYTENSVEKFLKKNKLENAEDSIPKH